MGRLEPIQHAHHLFLLYSRVLREKYNTMRSGPGRPAERRARCVASRRWGRDGRTGGRFGGGAAGRRHGHDTARGRARGVPADPAKRRSRQPAGPASPPASRRSTLPAGVPPIQPAVQAPVQVRRGPRRPERYLEPSASSPAGWPSTYTMTPPAPAVRQDPSGSRISAVASSTAAIRRWPVASLTVRWAFSFDQVS